jgi:triosephosphate isomerase
MAKPILVANWKNYPASLAEAKDLLKGYAKKKDIYKKAHFFIAPPAAYFESVSAKGAGELASQDFSALKGTHTGTIPAEILKSFGVRLAIVGHSERRALGETAEEAAEKAAAALKAGLTPLICFGEKARDADGEHFDFLRHEIKALLARIPKKDAAKVMLAYEPVWAVGAKATGALDPMELAQTLIFIKKVLSDLYGRALADKIPVLYGGSVDAENAGLLLRNSGARGLLVGRASLDPEKLAAIARSITAT